MVVGAVDDAFAGSHTRRGGMALEMARRELLVVGCSEANNAFFGHLHDNHLITPLFAPNLFPVFAPPSLSCHFSIHPYISHPGRSSLPRPFGGEVQGGINFVPVVAPPETVHLSDLLSTLREKADVIRQDTASAHVRPFVQAVQALCFAAGELELKQVCWCAGVLCLLRK